MKYVIEGGNKLEGEVLVSGNKNSIFPCMAASLLTDEEVILENVADINDSRILIQILEHLGIKVKKMGSKVVLKSQDFKKTTLPEDLVVKLRGSVVLIGAILGKLGRVKFHHPGGDVIGKRSIAIHLAGFKSLGAKVKRLDLEYSITFPDNSPTSNFDIFLEEASVTATENLILASVLGNKTVALRNCAVEPHVLDLCKLLIKMGANIERVGTNSLKIKGVSKLSGATFKMGTDYVEVGTYIIAAAITKGCIRIKGLDETDLDSILVPLSNFGINTIRNSDFITASALNLKSVPKLLTNIWPGFPTDLMSAAIVLATQSKGVTLCHDWMYESRMFFTDKLIAMGANITLADPHRVFVYGPSHLKARELETPDIRAGMALVLAAMVARGKSVINKAELIERGYENVVLKLKKLGAVIDRRENS